jgi:hypothetical protein
LLRDDDRRGFLGMVAQLPERFGLEIHAFVLEYQAAAQAVRQFQARMKTGNEEGAFVEQMKRGLQAGNRG